MVTWSVGLFQFLNLLCFLSFMGDEALMTPTWSACGPWWWWTPLKMKCSTSIPRPSTGTIIFTKFTYPVFSSTSASEETCAVASLPCSGENSVLYQTHLASSPNHLVHIFVGGKLCFISTGCNQSQSHVISWQNLLNVLVNSSTIYEMLIKMCALCWPAATYLNSELVISACRVQWKGTVILAA